MKAEIRTLSVSVVIALVMGVGAGNAAAMPVTGVQGAVPSAHPVQQPDPKDLEDALKRVPARATPSEAAEILFPGDRAAQREYLELAQDVYSAANRRVGGQQGQQGLPVLLAAFVPALARCVVGSLTGIGLGQAVNLARKGESLTLDGLVDQALAGCIGGILPPPLKAVANAAKRPLVAIITAIIIRLSA